MEEAFEWFDPYEQKQRADREERRANLGIQTGREQIESALARGARDHLSEKMEMAVAALAEKIARHVAYDLGASRAHASIEQDMGKRCGELFRQACREVLNGLELPDVSRVRTTVDYSPSRHEESMTIQYETLRPIQIAFQFRL
jgi:hypothetical protein